MDIIKMYIYSFIGIFIFFFPLRIEGVIGTTINHICNNIKYNHEDIIVLSMIIYIVINILKKYFIDKENLRLPVKQIISIIIIIVIFYLDILYEFINEDYIFFMQEIIIDTIVKSIVSIIFITLLIDYGLITKLDYRFSKKVKRILKINAIGIIASLIGSLTNPYVFYFIVNEMYKRNMLKEKESMIIFLLYCYPCINNIIFISNELNIAIFINTIITLPIILFSNFILSRSYPFTHKKNRFYDKTMQYKGVNYKLSYQQINEEILLDIDQRNIVKSVITYVEKTINVLIDIIPNLTIILVLIYSIYELEIINNIARMISNLLAILNISEIFIILKSIILSLIDGVFCTNMVYSSILKYETSIIIYIIILTQSITIMGNMLYVRYLDFKISINDIIYTCIGKNIIVLLITITIYYIYMGYVSLL